MTFNILFWAIFIASSICWLMDFARAKPDVDRNQNFLFDFGMLTFMVCVILIAGKMAIMLADNNILSVNQRAIIIAESIFLLVCRKATAILVPSLIFYFRSFNNFLSKLIDPKIIIKDPDPLADKSQRLSLGVLRIGHTVIYLFWIIITAISSAIPGVSNSRINILLYDLSALPGRMTGNGIERIGFMLWILLFAFFWIVFVFLIIRVYKNLMAHLDHKDDEIKPTNILLTLLVILWPIRKVFSYIFFGLPGKYVWQDLLFWTVIIAIAVLIRAIYKVTKRK